MKADFSGWATKAGLKCSDGRTIMPDAFKHQDKQQVPLVWQHGHSDVENVLGHAILENRPEGVYAYGFFNNTAKAKHAKDLVEHGDINMLSIWANKLIERSAMVLHGAIREVSLVLSGANPGALIENVTIRHSDGDDMVIEDEAIIYTGLGLELKHEEKMDENEETIEDIYNSMTDKQKTVLHFMVGEALASAEEKAQHSDVELGDDATIDDIYNSMTEQQQSVLHYMIGEALASVETDDTTDDNTDKTAAHGDNPEGTKMTNVFEQGGTTPSKQAVISHDDLKEIVADATKSGGSLKEAIKRHAVLKHGIEDIDVLFPQAKVLDNVPEFLKRRTEWVGTLLDNCHKSPFGRIRTLSANITHDEARAKGYIKGNMKREEFFSVSGRTTTPTTIYKKQKLDRDDMVDITDFDVVAWLKAEMRLMLDEELARAILIGDGRDFADDDKINEQNIRPIAKDHELFTTTVNVNIDDANSSVTEIIDAIIMNRRFYKGTGMPTMYTTETYISKFLLLKDSTGRRIYSSIQEIATELRVAAIVPVEVMEDEPNMIAVIVNPVDYAIGADRGGAVSMFDDFDIDYNQHKYLIETRVCGALRKLKSAMVIMKVPVSSVLVAPTAPTMNPTTFVVTIPNVTGVVYKNGAGTTLTAGAQSALAAGAELVVNATPASGYYFASSEDDTWTFTRPA